MPGQPQVRAAWWLHLDDSGIPAATVRIEQRMDGSGRWIVLHNVPAENPTRRSEHGSEHEAHAEAQRLRDWIDGLTRWQHGITGTWRINAREPY
ncbi:hypothetical protein [Micromonospora sp. NPDC049891]|uniref:hypothetical protein n=1 Tax=Micromonospora sp. NPDC049891 TaxID=3155655 RepID=UPI0033F5ED44